MSREGYSIRWNQKSSSFTVVNNPRIINRVGISLGWNCGSATFAVDVGIRARKANGYKTCPFDIMVSNYDGIVECIRDDFKYLCDDKYLVLQPYAEWANTSTLAIYNTRYNFEFTHESPGIADLYITEKWSGGINHFVDNNFAKLKERYERRVQNFRDYMNDPNTYIVFVLTTWNKTSDDVVDLKNVLKERYPALHYEILLRDEPKGEEYFMKHMRYMQRS